MSIELNVNAVGPDGNPVPSPIITLYVLDKDWHECPMEPRIRQQSNFYVDDRTFAQATKTEGPFFVYASVMAAGYGPAAVPMTPWDGASTLNISVTLPFKRPPCPAPVPRGILPPFPQPVNYRTTLPWTLPQSRDFLRADSWGVEMPGAPWVPGASTNFPDRILSWFIDRYDAPFRHAYLCKYGGWYTHLKRSYEDSCGPSDRSLIPYHVSDGPPGNDQTLQQFVASCVESKRYVKYVHVMLWSKDFAPWNMTLAEYQARYEPVIDALIAAKAVDELCPGWEWNLGNPGTPGPVTESIFKWVGQKAHAAGLSCWLHFGPHVTSWQTDGTDRFSFWDRLGTDVDGLNYQSQPEWFNKELQDRMVDTLWWFGLRGNIWKMRGDEDQASPEWDNFGPPHYPGLSYPEYANQRGFLMCCTVDDVRHTNARVWGYGNGGRMPDGSVL